VWGGLRQQYTWPPYEDRLCRVEKNIISVWKQPFRMSWCKEINSTYPSPSVRIPWRERLIWQWGLHPLVPWQWSGMSSVYLRMTPAKDVHWLEILTVTHLKQAMPFPGNQFFLICYWDHEIINIMKNWFPGNGIACFKCVTDRFSNLQGSWKWACNFGQNTKDPLA